MIKCMDTKNTVISIRKFDETSINDAKNFVDRLFKNIINNKSTPESLNYFQADTYKFYFLILFMKEYFDGNEISQEYAISLVPKKFASRIKRLQVLKNAVKLKYINEKSSQVDKRRKIYKPTEKLINDFLILTKLLT